MSTPVHAVATPLNTCRASRACRARRDERVARAVRQAQHVSTRLDTTFPYATMHGLDSVWIIPFAAQLLANS